MHNVVPARERPHVFNICPLRPCSLKLYLTSYNIIPYIVAVGLFQTVDVAWSACNKII